jgi:hypothetical protein
MFEAKRLFVEIEFAKRLIVEMFDV